MAFAIGQSSGSSAASLPTADAGRAMSKRRRLAGCAAALMAMAGLAGVAGAQSSQETEWCGGRDSASPDRKASPDQQIRGCTAEIQSGKHKGAVLAAAIYNRGVGYFKKGDYERAIQDFDQALRLTPKDADALYNRGIAKVKKGDKIGGEADQAAARRMNPNVGR
ncbi:MAG: tetratricopeptide repeat protein [Reyranella sp.]|nr:tetratricopeptide repeat protein [Reyranella sp.]